MARFYTEAVKKEQHIFARIQELLQSLEKRTDKKVLHFSNLDSTQNNNIN